ncbi:MAG: hypothetical protein M9921_08590 [Fimbriimonadaceae bacterium]|nr:hypothetical protein [Fimbriimonadaceae bacterium]
MSPPVESFDPSEVDERPRTSHLSKKELRNLLLGLALLLAILWPIYAVMKGNSERHLCSKNFQAIATAMGLYMADHGDRFPPVYATAGGDTPLTDDEGRPFTWCSLLEPYFTERATFVCPTATEEENVRSQAGQSSGTLRSSYGMFTPYGGYYKETVSNLSQIVLVAETSNFGARDTYDPNKFMDADGKPVPQDGFAIGFDRDSVAQARAVTRLALPGTSDGKFEKDDSARHPGGIWVLYGDLRLGLVQPTVAKVDRLGGEIVGAWAVPPDRR